MTILAAALHSRAQTEAGRFLLGGDLEFSSTKSDEALSKSTGVLILPNAGYFISDNLAIGAGIGYQTGKYRLYDASGNYNLNTDIKTHGFIFNPFVRKYKNITEVFKFYAQLSGTYLYSKSKDNLNTADNYDVKLNSYVAQLSPGLVFFPSQRFGIEFAISGISYNYTKRKYPDHLGSFTSRDFSIGANFLAPRIGVQYYFE